MSDKQKKAIDNNCNTETAGKVGEHWGKMEDAGIDKIKAESGHEVYKLTPEQIGLWKKASEPLTKTWGDGVKKNGGDPDAALAELRAALKKYNALAEESELAIGRGGPSAAPLSATLVSYCRGHESLEEGPVHRHHRMDCGRICRRRCPQHFPGGDPAQHAQL